MNARIKVDGGPSVGLTQSDGQITLNAVLCQQYQVGNSWPKTYWNCVNPSAPTTLDKGPTELATSLTTAARTRFGTNNVYLYVFGNISAPQAYFADSITGDATGVTFKIGTSIYASISETYVSGGTMYSLTGQPQTYEVTAHELGHALGNFILAGEPTSTTYINSVMRDYINLDYYSIGASQAASTARLPCQNAPDGTTGPFVNVNDESTTHPFCGSGTGYDATYGIETKYINTGTNKPKSNSYIFQTGAPYIMGGSPTTGWTELYPQSFSINVAVKNTSPANYLSYG